MLYTKQQVQDNIRNRQGKRVFFLGKEDLLTNEARDYLTAQRIEILPGEQAKISQYRLENGGVLFEKPEHMTHLQGDVLVSKTHPRIAFRGAMDTLQSEILLCQQAVPERRQQLQQLLDLARRLISCDVMEEPVGELKLCGLDEQAQRSHSHNPQKYYGIPHFMPDSTDSRAVLELNRVRCFARQAELAAAKAFCDGQGLPTRPDILQALNRMSSMLYILMIQEKAGQGKEANNGYAKAD